LPVPVAGGHQSPSMSGQVTSATVLTVACGHVSSFNGAPAHPAGQRSPVAAPAPPRADSAVPPRWSAQRADAVEGRNGQRSLHHHGRHRLKDRKLAALTAVHHVHIRRADATTAAERFFGQAHEPLFAQVLQRMPLPPPPARRRPARPQAALAPADGGVAGSNRNDD
jgi:hypothetical protein